MAKFYTPTIEITMNQDYHATAFFEEAVVEQHTLIISVIPPSGGYTIPEAGYHLYPTGTEIPLDIYTNPGYEFDRVEAYVGGDLVDTGYDTHYVLYISTNFEIVAYFNKISVGIPILMSVDPVGGGYTSPSIGSHTYPEDEVVPIVAYANPGYEFDRWRIYIDGEVTRISHDPEFYVEVVCEGIEVIAFFKSTGNGVDQYTLTVSVDPVGGGYTTPEVGSYDYAENSYVSLSAFPNSGYVFDYWKDGSGNIIYSQTIGTVMRANYHLTAHFKLQVTEYCILSVDVNGSGTVSPAGGTFEKGQLIPITAYPSAGWKFKNWGGTDNNYINPTAVTMDVDKSITAYFEVIPITERSLTLAISGQGTTDPAPGNYSYVKDAVVALIAYPASGWRFSQWQGADMNNTNPTTVTMDADKYIVAMFIQAGEDTTQGLLSMIMPIMIISMIGLMIGGKSSL